MMARQWRPDRGTSSSRYGTEKGIIVTEKTLHCNSGELRGSGDNHRNLMKASFLPMYSDRSDHDEKEQIQKQKQGKVIV